MTSSRDSMLSSLLEEDWDDFVSNGIPSIVILSLIALVGTVGNLITCLVSFFRKQSSTHQTLVMFLAAVDLCSCTISIPLAALWIRYPYTFTSAEVCKLSRFLSIFLSTCSYAVLDIIAIERYGKVVWAPEKQLTPRQAKAICISVYIYCGVFVALPAFFVYGISERTTPKGDLTGYECSVLTETRGTTFLTLYLMFGVVLVLVLFGCCFIIYGLIGRRFIILSRASQLQPSESFQKQITCDTDPASGILSDFSVSCNEPEKYNYTPCIDTSQQGTVSKIKIVITDEENELSTIHYMDVNNSDTHSHENCHNSAKGHCIQSQQRSSNQCHVQSELLGNSLFPSLPERPEDVRLCHVIPSADDTNFLKGDRVSVKESALSLSSTRETNTSPVNGTTEHLGQGSSKITSLPSGKNPPVNDSDILTCDDGSFDSKKRTVKFRTDITVDNESPIAMDTDYTIKKKTRKLSSENVINNGKLGKKILRGKKVTLMFFILSLISILSYLPFFVIVVIRNMDWSQYEVIKNTLGPLEGVMLSFVYINNAINPVIYGFMDSVFRKDCQTFIEQVKYYVF